MKKSTLIVGMLLLYVGISAQQDPQFTQWMFDKVSFNPAATGVDDVNMFTAFYRDQWDQLERDPKTAMFNYNGSFFGNAIPSGRVGLGVVFASDRLGQMQNTMFKLNLGYHHNLNGMELSGGFSLGQYATTLGDDWQPYQQGDAIIPDDSQTASAFDFGFGAMISKKNEWYAGVSATHLTEADLTDLNINVISHYYIMGGYNYDLPISAPVTLRSNALIKTDANATAFDINLNALYNNMFWGGISFRPEDAIAPMAGIQYQLPSKSKDTFNMEQKIMFGYSYDATTSLLKNYSTGSHEIFVTYCFTYTPIVIKKPYSNPRFIHNKIN